MQLLIPTIASHPYLALTLQAYRSISGQIPITLVAGSPETAMLKSLKERFELNLLCLGENRGFPGNVNAAMRTIEDDIVVISNDDVVPLSLEWPEVVEEDLKHDKVAALGPVSNSCLIPQLYDHPGPVQEMLGVLSFFWIAMKKKTWEEVGELDERFGQGLCEDLDWCFRARKTNKKLILDRRLFVWHWGSSTLNQLVPDVEEATRANRKLLNDKYKDDSAYNWNAPVGDLVRSQYS